MGSFCLLLLLFVLQIFLEKIRAYKFSFIGSFFKIIFAMSYFSDESETLGVNFEMLAIEKDLKFFRENRELILMGMVEHLKSVLKDLKESFSLKEFREIVLCGRWSCCISKTESLHVFCYLQPVLDLSNQTFGHLLGLLRNHYKAYVIKFRDERTRKICDCEFCDYNIFIWEHMDTFEKNGLKVKERDKVSGKMLLEILKISRPNFLSFTWFLSEKIGRFVYGKVGGKRTACIARECEILYFEKFLSRDIPYLVHDANHTACLVYGTRQKGLSYDVENKDEFWEIFSLFLKHKGCVLAKQWV